MSPRRLIKWGDADQTMYAGFGSRTPGVVIFNNAKVRLPVVR